MTYDGSININTRIDQQGFQRGINGIQSQLGSLKSSIFGVGKALGLSFGVKKLMDFAVASANAASDLVEVQNVVDKAFGSMSGHVESFAKTAIKQFGLTELQAKQFSSTFMVMGTSMGVMRKEAEDMAIDLAGLAGDVASFRNISQDAAFGKLKGIYTGETEALKELGVVMTEDNLKAYALSEGIRKNYSEMSQAEKVTLRYGFVTSALAQSRGDFADTVTSWANNVRVLKNQLISLQAVIGKGFMALLNPVVTVANRILSTMLDLANGISQVFSAVFGTAKTELSATTAGLTEGLEDVSGAASGAAGGIGEVKDATEDAAKAAKELERATMTFDKINKVASGSQSDSGNKGTGKTDGMGVTVGSSEAVGSMLDDVLHKTEEFSEGMKRFRDYLAGLDFNPLRDSWEHLKESGGELAKVLKKDLLWCLENVLEPLGKWTIEEAAPRQLETLANVMGILADLLEILGGPADFFWQHFLKPLAEQAGTTYTDSLDGLNQMLSDIKGGLDDILAVINGDMTLSELMKKWFSMDNIEEMSKKWNESLGKMLKLSEFVSNPVSIPVALAQQGWKTVWGWVKEKWGAEAAALVELAKKNWSTVWSWIKEKWGTAKTAAVELGKKGWSTVWGWVKNHIGTPFKAKIELLKGWTGTVAKALGLDKLSSKFSIKLPKIDVTWSGSPIKLPKFNVKWNAKGGILDSAAIFGMAGNTLLGGGEAGREAILPLDRNTGWMDTLAQRISKSMGSGQPIVVQVTLDGKVVGQSVVNYVNGQARATGVNPIASYL